MRHIHDEVNKDGYGPQFVGGRYFSGYWQKGYTVLEFLPNGMIRVLWDDGEETTHFTMWDYGWDKVIQQP